MGPTAGQIREELDHHRDDAAGRLAELEHRVESMTEEARTQVQEATGEIRTQVEDTKQQIQQTFDIKYQLQENPLIAVGGGLLLGFLLGGGLSGGGGGGYQGQSGQGSSAVTRHLRESMMQSARSSGLSDTMSAAGSALLSEVTKTVKGAIGQSGSGGGRS